VKVNQTVISIITLLSCNTVTHYVLGLIFVSAIKKQKSLLILRCLQQYVHEDSIIIAY